MFFDRRPRLSASSLEVYSWLFMRLSGLLLIFLALGHLAVMHVLNSVEAIDYRFVAARLAGPMGTVWRAYDLLLLTLALLHGLNGVRTVLDDYLHTYRWRVVSLSALYVIGAAFMVVGAVVLFRFQPEALP